MDGDERLTAFRIDVEQTFASAGMGGTSTQVPSSNSMYSMEGTNMQLPSFNSNNLNQLNMGAANVEDTFFRDFTNQVSQPGQNQLLLQPFMSSDLHQQYNQPALMMSNMPYDLQKQQLQPVLQPQLHSSLQFMCPTLVDQWQTGQSQNLQLQNNFLERQQQLPLNQQPLELLCRDSRFQGGLQQMFQTPSALLGSQNAMAVDHQNPQREHSQSVFLNSSSASMATAIQTELACLADCQDQAYKQIDLQKRLDRQSAILIERQNAMAVSRPNPPLGHSQKVVINASSAAVDSTSQKEPDDWQDQAYKQVMTMREMYLSDVLQLQKRAQELCLQQSGPEFESKNQKIRTFIKQIILFLTMPREDMIHYSKKEFRDHKSLVMSYMNFVRSRISLSSQQHGQQQLQWQNRNLNSILGGSLRGGLAFNVGSSKGGVPISKPQGNVMNSIQTGTLGGTTRPVTSNAVSSLLYGSVRSIPYAFKLPQQTKLMTSLPVSNGLPVGSQQRTSSPIQFGAVKAIHQNTSPMPKQPYSSSMAFDITDPYMRTSMVLSSHKNNQQPTNQTSDTEKNKQKMDAVSNLKAGQVSSSGKNQQQSTIDQYVEPSPPPPPQSPMKSPIGHQASLHSSPQAIPRNTLALCKSGTPLFSSTSTLSMPVDPEKHSSGFSPLPIAENPGHPKTAAEFAQLQSQEAIQNETTAIDTPWISTSPFLIEFTSPEENQQSPAAEEPINRLLKAVQSISPKALSSSLKEIGAVVTMTDRMAGSDEVPRGRTYTGLDLSQELGYQLRRKNSTPTKGGSKEKMRRDTDALPLDDLSSTFSPDDLLEWLNDPESGMETKKPRIEPSAQLLAEINKINGKLVETMLEVVVDSTDDAATAGFANGTIVKCSFVGVSFESFFKQKNVSSELMPSLFLRFLVPVDYPNSSPAVVDILPDDSSGEPKDLKEKIKMMFSSSISKLSHPMSLGEMAKAWDTSARAVLTDFASTMGGTKFSVRYGKWEPYKY